jgi:O-antigen/teichoic acid export membrane protein
MTTIDPKNRFFKLFRQSSHYLLGNISLMITGFISFPILTRVLSTEDYGLLSLVSITLWISLALTKAGQQESAIRFYDEYESGKREAPLSEFYSTLFISAIIFALLVAGLVALGGAVIFQDAPHSRSTLIWLLVALIFTGSVFLRISNFLRAEQHTKRLNVILVIRQYSVLISGLLFFFAFSRSLVSYYTGIVVAETLLVCVLTIKLFQSHTISLQRFSIPFLKESLIFGVPLIGLELANFLIKSVDRYLIKIFIDLEAVGLYSAGSNLCQYLKDSIIYAVLYAVTPLYMQLWNQEGKERTEEFLSRVISFLLYILVPILFGFIALSKPLIVLLASEKYMESATIIPYILPGILLWGLSPLFAAGIYIQKKTQILFLVVMSGVILNGGLNVLLIPQFQLLGAALATLISFILLMGALVAVSNRYLRITIDKGIFVRTLLASVVMFVILKLIPLESTILGLIAEIMIGIICFGVLIWIVDREARTLVRSILPKFKPHSLQTHSEKI